MNIEMNSVYSSLQGISDREEMLLRGISSRDQKEREKSIQKYKEWIGEEILNSNKENYKSIGDNVLHALQVKFGCQNETEMIGFIELMDAVLSFPSFVEDRLLFLTSLLEEVIQGEVTENMVDPLVCVFFPFYHEK